MPFRVTIPRLEIDFEGWVVERSHSATCASWECRSPTTISLAHLGSLARDVSRAMLTARRGAARERRDMNSVTSRTRFVLRVAAACEAIDGTRNPPGNFAAPSQNPCGMRKRYAKGSAHHRRDKQSYRLPALLRPTAATLRTSDHESQYRATTLQRICSSVSRQQTQPRSTWRHESCWHPRHRYPCSYCRNTTFN